MESLTESSSDELINRRQELAWLEFNLEQAAQGKARVVLVTGDAGVGKSRLIRELLRRTHQRHLIAAIGRGHEGLTVPYLAFGELLEGLTVSARNAGLDPPSVLHARPHEGNYSGEADRTTFLLSVSRFVLAIAQTRPLLLAVDDVQWLDHASLDLLSHLVGAIADAQLSGPTPVVLLLTSRRLDLSTRAGTICTRLLREDVCEELELAGLDETDTLNLIAARGIARPSYALSAAIFEQTAGNPLFVQAVVRRLLMQRSLSRAGASAGASSQTSELRLPTNLTAALSAQAHALVPPCQTALENAALLGLQFRLDHVAALCNMSETQLLELFVEASHLVRRVGDLFEFNHPLTRQVFVERMSKEVACERHARIARLYDETLIDAAARTHWELVTHLIAAGPYADPAKLLGHALLAAARAVALWGFGEAATAYAAAALVAPSTAQRAELHYKAGLCYARNSDQGPSAEHYASALVHYRELGDRSGIASVLAESARNELYREPIGKLRDLTPLLAAVEALGDSEPRLRSALLARIADAYHYAQRPREGIDYAGRALECGQLAQDHKACRDACLPLALCQQLALRFREAKATFVLALEHCEASGDDRSQNAVRNRLAGVLHMLGEVQAGLREVELARSSAERTNDIGELALAHAEIAQIQSSCGNFAAVTEHVQAALRLRARLTAPWAFVTAVLALSYVRFLRGEWQAAEDALVSLDQTGRVLGRAGAALHVMSIVYRELVRSTAGLEPEDARLQKERILRYAERATQGAGSGGAIVMAAALVELAAIHALPEAAHVLTPLLLRAEEAGVVLGQGWPLPTARALALAAVARGEPQDAKAWYERALRETSSSGAEAELARSELELARLLSADDNADSDARARELVASAAARFAMLQLTPWYKRAKQLADVLGLRLRPQVDALLTPLDRELLRGLLNERPAPALADDLLLRPTTLNQRMHSLYKQLGVNGRMEAAAYALSHGIAGSKPAIGTPLILLVTDLEGFTEMLELLGDVRAQVLIRLHNRILRSCVRDCGGSEITHTGDGIIASFRSVRDAISCAIAIQAGFDEYNRGQPVKTMRVRIGLHAGEPLPEEGRLFGVAVNATVRICAACEPARILASKVVLEGAGQLTNRFSMCGERALKGLTQPLELFDIRWHEMSSTTLSVPNQ